MVKLESDASYTSYVQPVDYASATDTFSSTDECFISGWGLESGMMYYLHRRRKRGEGNVSSAAGDSNQV